MSKEIFLYSEDKKYKCGVELSESTDRFGCPDHSMIVLFEEREDGTYIIAEARDRLLETQKDKQLAELKAELKSKQSTIDQITKDNKTTQDLILNLQQQLKDNTKQVCEKIIDRMQNIEFNCDTDFQSMISILDQIENEKESN